MSDNNPIPNTHCDKRRKLDDDIDQQINNDEDIRRWRGECGDDIPDDKIRFLLDIIEEYSCGQMLLPDEDTLSRAWPELEDKLRAAWRSKSYREIMQFDHLKSSSGPIKPPIFEEEYGYYADLAKELWEAWKAPFQGDYHEILFANINAMYRSKPWTGNCAAIIQSSGTGKSRMVDEQAKLVFTFPMNIRDTRGLIIAHPHQDKPLYDHLVICPPVGEKECKAYYVTFFRCLFFRTARVLSTFDVSGNDLVRKWYECMDDREYRHNFYQSVVRLCNGPLSSGWNTYDELSHLISMLEKRCPTINPVKMVIYIDEAHELKKSGETQLDHMYSVIYALDQGRHGLFCLLLSTQPSLRFVSGLVLNTITETPFDCSPGLLVEPGVLHVKDLSTGYYVAKWGRPLWWTKRPDTYSETLIEIVVDFARMKLLCNHRTNDAYQGFTRAAQVAVLNVLLAFDFKPGSSVRVDDLQADMVERHMRIIYSVQQRGTHLQSGYPSEPMLAEAAARQLWTFRDRTFWKTPTTFDIMVKVLDMSGMVNCSGPNAIDLGKCGELAMRVFLMRAYLDSVLLEFGDQKMCGIVFSRGCKLTTFVNELFGSEHALKVLGGTPDNAKDSITLSRAFERSMVRFTHFVKAGDTFALTSEALCAAFTRGFAFIGPKSQRYVEIAIPVLLDEESAIQESAMSAILVQVKRHIRDAGPTTRTFSERDIALFPVNQDEELRKRPYIVLIAELGRNLDQGKVNDVKAPFVDILGPEEGHDPDDPHPRYAIVTYGSGVYKDVKPEQYNLLAGGLSDLLEEHPRKDDVSRNLMMRLKPVWERGDNSYHWFENSDAK